MPENYNFTTTWSLGGQWIINFRLDSSLWCYWKKCGVSCKEHPNTFFGPQTISALNWSHSSNKQNHRPPTLVDNTGKCIKNFENVISEHMLQITFMSTCEIALRWIPQNTLDEKPTLVEVMAWYFQATCHYLSQCWPKSMSPYGAGHRSSPGRNE